MGAWLSPGGVGRAGPGPGGGVVKARPGLAERAVDCGGVTAEREPNPRLGSARTSGHAHMGTEFLWKAEPRLLKTISSYHRSALTNTFSSGFKMKASNNE